VFFCGKTRAERDYNQGNRITQGKTAKKAGKMQFFWRYVEIAAKTAVRTHAAAIGAVFGRRRFAGIRMSHPKAKLKQGHAPWVRLRVDPKI
jgi:hypothetical protein